MEIVAYAASVLIGISLGLIGSGGSILTVPVLVYLFGINPFLATSYSLFIVGSTSLVGTIKNFNNKLINIRTAWVFALTSICTVFLIRKLVLPLIPKSIKIGDYIFTETVLIMILFAILMIGAGYAMIKNAVDNEEAAVSEHKINTFKLIIFAFLIGLTTGFLGAGGGFLIIPVLVIFVGLPIKEAVATSLFIITLNSLIGFLGDIGHFIIDWFFLFKVTALAISGIFAGGYLNKKISPNKLKKGFGYFVYIMGFYIIIKEIWLN